MDTTTVAELIEFIAVNATESMMSNGTTLGNAPKKRRMLFPTLKQNVPISILTILIGIVGLLGNTMVIYVIYHKTNLARQTTTKYIINQCALDAISSITLLLTETVALSQLGYVSPKMANFFCQLWLLKHPFVYGIILSSTYNLVMISVERYVAICFPVFYRTRFTYKFAYMTIGVIWVMGVIYIVALGVPSVHLNDVGRCFYKRPSKKRGDFNAKVALTVKIIIPIVCHAYCYVFITMKLAGGAKIGSATPQGESSTVEGEEGFEDLESTKDTSKASTSSASNKPTQAQQLKQKARMNVIKTLAIVTVVYLICWLPQNMYVTLFRFGVVKSFGSTYKVFVVMMFANCSVNPFIYVANYEVFRKAFKSMLGMGK